MEDASTHVHSVGAKPRILRALPGLLSEARLGSGGDVSSVEAAVANHCLLCETFADGSNASSHHAAAIDAYLKHVESLVVPHASSSSKTAGSNLLKQAAKECGPKRFVASLSRWGIALGKLADGKDVDGAPSTSALNAMQALVQIITRASAMMDVPGVRKETAQIAQKACAVAVRWLDECDGKDNLLTAPTHLAALHTIKACLHGHPASLRPKVDVLEKALVKALLASSRMGNESETQNTTIDAIAFLPRTGASPFQSSNGSNDPVQAFSQQMRRVLLLLHKSLDHGLIGMEPTLGGSLVKQQRESLVPTGSQQPPKLGGENTFDDGQERIGGEKSKYLHRASLLFRVIACMLRQPFPNTAAVPVPADLILGVTRRALAADGSGVSPAPGLPATAAPAEALAALPSTHAAAMDSLAALLEAGGGAYIRLAGPVARVLDQVLRAGAGTNTKGKGSDGKSSVQNSQGARPSTCAQTRAAAYRVAACCARALGPACAAGELASVVVPHAAKDAVLGWGTGTGQGPESSNGNSTKSKSKDTSGNSRKKGKGGAWGRAGTEEMDAYLASGGLVDQRGGIAGGGVGRNSDFVKQNALDVLEAVLTSGGGMVPNGLRTLIDAACAESASFAVWAISQGSLSVTNSIESRSKGALGPRKAAYSALLASVLAPRSFRATNLPLAAALFRAARIADVELSVEASRASLAIEAVLHPSAPPIHPSAIAPPKESIFWSGGDTNDGTNAFGGNAGWGDDDAFGRTTPAWGDVSARPDKEVSPESEDESEKEDEAAHTIEEDAEIPTKCGAKRVNVPDAKSKETEAPPVKKAKTDKGGDTEKTTGGDDLPTHDEPVATSGRASRTRGKPSVPIPTTTGTKPSKPMTKKEKAAAAKAAKETEAARLKLAAENAVREKLNQKSSGVGLGLGSGKSSVQMELSDDDSDGELPEIVG